jgi:hypothetical protein
MTKDDDKQSQESDPWAGLDIGGTDDKVEELSFDFAGLEDEPQPAFHPGLAQGIEEMPVAGGIEVPFESDAPPVEEPMIASLDSDPDAVEESTEPFVAGDASPAEEQQDASLNEIPLAVFPPPEVEAAGSDILIGTGRSGIISMPDVPDESAPDDFAIGDFANDEFDDQDIAHELGLADLGGEPMAGDAIETGSDLGGAPDFGESAGDPQSEDVSFDTGVIGGAFPFADNEPVPGAMDLGQDGLDQNDADSIALPGAAVVAAGAAAAATAAKHGARPASTKKKGSGIGQMVGVVLGGLMALPVTYAILIWGFHKDPFKFAKKAPPQLAFLLPEKLQPGYRPAKKAEPASGLKNGPSLDDLPTGDEVATAAVAEPTATDAAATEPTEPTEPTERMNVAGSDDEPEPPLQPTEPAAKPDEAAQVAQPADGPVTPGKDAGAQVAAALPAMAADSELDAVLGAGPLPGLDAVMDDAVSAAPIAAPAALPPLDLTGVETAAERASQAFEALATVSDPADPARDRLSVAWYKRLAQLGEELVRLETAASDSGRSLSEPPAAANVLFDRICDSDAAVKDLERLGLMWLTKQKQQADGVTLLATLGASRQVGPYWSTRAVLSGVRGDGTDRTVAVISRLAPPADAGERVMISGVLFDGDTVWAADVRPVDRQQPADFEQE